MTVVYRMLTFELIGIYSLVSSELQILFDDELQIRQGCRGRFGGDNKSTDTKKPLK